MSDDVLNQKGIATTDSFYRKNTNLPTKDVQFQWTPEMVTEIEKSTKSVNHFAENYFWAVTTSKGKQKLELYKAQKKLLKMLDKNRFVITLASRQSGKTTVMTIFSLWYTCFQNDKKVLVVANREDTAKDILRRIKFAYEMLPNWLKPGVENWGQTEVFFSNGSSITISATSSTAARGMAINVLIVDEMAFIPDHIMSEFWNSVIPVISSDTTRQTKIFAVSTPNGTSNLYYKIYSAAERGEMKIWKSFRIDWYEIPGRDQRWKEEMEEALASEGKNFAQEFGNQFIEVGETTIDVAVLDKLKQMCRNPEFVYKDGKYKIWFEPDAEKIYTIGIDVSEGVGGCASVIQVFDITDLTNIEQVAVYADDLIDPYHFAEFINHVANQWGQPPLLIERNGPGGQVIDALSEVHHYGNIISYNPETQKKKSRLGIFSHTNSKAKAVTNMRYWANTINCVNIYDLNTVQEMETFVKHPNGTWKKRSGNHVFDDRVMAMIWALFCLTDEIVRQYFDVAEFDTRGKPLRINSLNDIDPGLYKLDKYYTDETDAPLPTHFNFNSSQNDSMEDLMSKGWVIPE